jgi:hypothetical protein
MAGFGGSLLIRRYRRLLLLLEQPCLQITVNYNLFLENNVVFCWIVHHKFQCIKIIPPHISSWQSGSYQQSLIQQIVHAAFDALAVTCGGEAALSLR